jgi:hypothetical protein
MQGMRRRERVCARPKELLVGVQRTSLRPGTQFTCFTGTKVQILTAEVDVDRVERGVGEERVVGSRMMWEGGGEERGGWDEGGHDRVPAGGDKGLCGSGGGGRVLIHAADVDEQVPVCLCFTCV